MNIVVKSLQNGQTPLPLAQQGTYFADSFLRADEPFLLGDNWLTCFYDSDVQTTATNIQALVNVNAVTGLTILNNTGASTIPKFLAFPSLLNGALLNVNSQFGEMQCIGAAGNTDGVGSIMLFGSMNTAQGYLCAWSFVAGVRTYYVARNNNNVFTILIAAQPWVNNDILRLEIVPSAASNLITVYRNGVQEGQVVDNAATRLAFGIPGIHSTGMATGASISFANFKCGILPQVSTAPDFP